MTFALEGTVADMRELLLQYGAQESKEEKLRWLICQDAANLAHHRREAFYGDDLSGQHVWGEKTCLLHVPVLSEPVRI